MAKPFTTNHGERKLLLPCVRGARGQVRRMLISPSCVAACIRSSCSALRSVVSATRRTAVCIADQDGDVRGSKLLGQQFTADKYFQSRPSAAGNGYDATSSGGSNLGPTSQKLDDTIKQRIAAYRTQNGLSETEPVPADAVTASGSGLDPEISLRNAELQVPRVAKTRRLAEDKVRELVQQNTDGRDLGIFGDPGVNVLQLNLALDQQH